MFLRHVVIDIMSFWGMLKEVQIEFCFIAIKQKEKDI